MKWDNYVESLLYKRCAFDDVYLSIGETEDEIAVPPIIKVSVLILDKLIKSGQNNNVIVFPERNQSSFIFTLIKLVHNIASGEIEKSYDPNNFNKGQKLKYKNCIMEFDRIDYQNGKEMLFVRFTDLLYGLPIEIAPFLQLTNSNMLSRYNTFAKNYRIQDIQKHEKCTVWNEIIRTMQDFKTHMESSVFYVAPIASTIGHIFTWRFNGKGLKDIFHIGKTDYSGNIKNIGAGQLSGTPSIVLASDPYAVNTAMNKGAPIQSLIIDISNSNVVNCQLDAIDNIIREDIPITCITDAINSFDLQPFTDRGFNVWRWDENYITESLYRDSNLLSDKKAELCVKRTVKYITADDDLISNLVKKLYSKKSEVKDQSIQMNDIFTELFRITLNVLRRIVPYTDAERTIVQRKLSECKSLLQKEHFFISKRTYLDYETIIEDLKLIISASFVLPKVKSLEEILKRRYKTAHLVVPKKISKEYIVDFWCSLCSKENIDTDIIVLHPDEYINIKPVTSSVAIVCGWFSNVTMRKLLYSYNAHEYIVLLYDCEKRWKKAHTSSWKKNIGSANNKSIIKHAFNVIHINSPKEQLGLNIAQYDQSNSEIDELNEIELFLKESTIRKYVSKNSQSSDCQTVEAVPISFMGGYLSFLRKKHKVITVTDIIMNDSEKEMMKEASQLQIGEFVVLREADRDIIRELADIILVNSGKSHLRALATRWKESLKIESIFSSYAEIYDELKAVGCTVTYQTVRGWITDENKISPGQKEDLIYIAQATKDKELLNIVNEVYEAARVVISAHIQAGRYLSAQLKTKIASALHEYNDIDPHNLWEPIVLTFDDIGTVKILKVIEIGPVVVVDSINTNRLIEEKEN